MSTMEERLKSLKELTKKRNAIKDEMGAELYDSMYDMIYSDNGKSEIKSHVENSVEFILATDNENDYGDFQFVADTYNPKASLVGLTDYKDHSEDSLSDFKQLLKDNFEVTTLPQSGHLYNKDGELFDTIVFHGFSAGWKAQVAWSDGSVSFFEYIR